MRRVHSSDKDSVLTMQLKLLSDEDSEVIYRTLYATGNLVRYSFFFFWSADAC